MRVTSLSILVTLTASAGALVARNHSGSLVNSPAGAFVGNSSIPDIDQYLGIPYAKPPVGSLRFAAPEPLDVTFHDPFNATSYSPGCMQDPAYALYNGLSENCLTLNVVRPQRQSKCARKLPVLFWIHGGGNANGQSIFYNGTSLVRHSVAINQPVIYVGINYRLAGFGFLNSPSFQAAGLSDDGLKDQYRALQWVHENIASFGGDPSKVIIFGESAGAYDSWAQLHYAYVKNETGKYFHGMITNSGSPGSPQGPHAYSPDAGLAEYRELLSKADCLNATDDISCLRRKPIDTVAPLLDTYPAKFTLDHDWFSDNMTDLLTSDTVAPIPIIHGSNLNEGAVFLPNIFPNEAIPTQEDLTAYVASFVNASAELAAEITRAYFSEDIPLPELGQNYNGDTTAPNRYWPALAIYGDAMFDLGRRALVRNACSRQVPVWAYHLDQTPPLSLLNASYEYPGYNQSYAKRVGVFHGTDLGYYFGDIANFEGATKGDVAVSTTMMSAFISFAHSLDPNTEGVPEWPQFCQDLGSDGKGGTSMYFTEQGDQRIGARLDIPRQAVYDAWNRAREALGLRALY